MLLFSSSSFASIYLCLFYLRNNDNDNMALLSRFVHCDSSLLFSSLSLSLVLYVQVIYSQANTHSS